VARSFGTKNRGSCEDWNFLGIFGVVRTYSYISFRNRGSCCNTSNAQGPRVNLQQAIHVSYAAPQAHGNINVALHQKYSQGIVFIFSQGRKDLCHV
jgi:hypothetical protein